MARLFRKLSVLGAFTAGISAAQIFGGGPGTLMNRQALADDDVKMAEARRRAAAEEDKEFRDRMNAFAAAWNLFVNEYQDRGTFNAKKAKALQRAWKNIESNLAR